MTKTAVENECERTCAYWAIYLTVAIFRMEYFLLCTACYKKKYVKQFAFCMVLHFVLLMWKWGLNSIYKVII